ncbi:KilA-N domain-containing protein [Mucilaginibacter sp.]|uniref:KilA-N domain-containing protein n=1 Tax=Mucilaginibacter sp. TaxID=1882438 RepID=UPI003263E58E
MSKIKVEGVEINILTQNDHDYISLTDMAKSQHENIIITKWLSLKNTIEYIGEWEALYNPDFNYTDFGTIKNTAGGNNFVLSVKEWIEKTKAIGIRATAGRYGGTYAHKDIAFHFGMWMSPRFQLLLVKEFQRLKEEETKRLNSEWDYRRFLSKANYTIHTDSIQRYVIPRITDDEKKKWVYSTEADLLNIALFGFTAAQWRDANPKLAKQNLNVRDLSDAHELLVLSNLEGLNAILNQQGIENHNKLELLRKAAVQQLVALRASVYTFDQIKSPFKQIIFKKDRSPVNDSPKLSEPTKDSEELN